MSLGFLGTLLERRVLVLLVKKIPEFVQIALKSVTGFILPVLSRFI